MPPNISLNLEITAQSNLQSIGNLRNSYGSTPYPTPPMDLLRDLVARDIMQTSLDNIIGDPVFDPVSRADVGQGPLVKVWTIPHC